MKSIRNNFNSPSNVSFSGNKNELVLISVGMMYGISISVFDQIFKLILYKTENKDNFNHEADYDYAIIIKRLMLVVFIGNMGLVWLCFVEQDFYTLRYQLIGLVLQKCLTAVLFNIIYPIMQFY